MSRQAQITQDDLDNCAREPIHVPGRIQPHGVLVSLAASDRSVIRVSENAEKFGFRLSGATLDEVLGRDVARLAFEAFGKLREGTRNLGEIRNGEKVFDCVVHASGGELVVELEELGHSAAKFSSMYESVTSALELIEKAATLEELFGGAASECRRLSGYDRVMIYKFDRDWNGTVIAESRDERLAPFLGLRFPASDIPAQARALYLRNWLRYIPSVAYAPVSILPRNSGAAPLDLSFSILRSVSPVHLEYLRNMKVGASMSVSIIRDGKLWGLIAFHHDTERFLPYELRQGLELVGKFLSLQIAAKEKLELREYREELARRTAKIEALMRRNGDPFDALLASAPELLGLVEGCTGFALLRDGKTHAHGKVPSTDALFRLGEWLKLSLGRGPVLVTENLARELPWGESPAASGVLAVSVPEASPAYLLWFKPEVVQTVSWAGNPEKSVERVNGQTRLNPRHSFSLWQENLRDRSLPYGEEEIAEVQQLRRSVIEQDLERQVSLVSQSNAELDQYASVISHDLKEPLRGIESLAGFLSEDAGPSLDPASKENLESIQRLAGWGRKLIAELYTYSKIGRTDLRVEPVSMEQLVREVEKLLLPQLKGSRGSVRVEGILPTLNVDRLRVTELLQNLIGNALKYNESGAPIVEVSASSRAGVSVFTVSDNGIGVPAPDRRRIFNVFERLHGPEAFGGGSGMGLAIARRVAERHGGEIWMEESERGGSSFRFTLSPASEKK